MKVIFLDFDGVINNWDTFNEVSFENVLKLLEIVKATDSKIVATTSNKYDFQVHGIKYEDTDYFRYVSILKEYGIEIFDVTPYVDKNREFEIVAYLKEHPEVTDFLILDDEYVIDSLKEHQVFLDLYNGICEEHIKPAMDTLNGKLGFYPKDFDFNETCKERIIRINEYHSKKR